MPSEMNEERQTINRRRLTDKEGSPSRKKKRLVQKTRQMGENEHYQKNFLQKAYVVGDLQTSKEKKSDKREDPTRNGNWIKWEMRRSA